MPHRPHQAAYWHVTLPRDDSTRAAKRDWCRNNLDPRGARLPWVFPRAQPVSNWYDQPNDSETWQFARHDDAVMFELAWA